MNDADNINPEVIAASKEIWIALIGNGDGERLFNSIEKALEYCEQTHANRVPYVADTKTIGGDDNTDLPEGSVTSLCWRYGAKRGIFWR